jgi:putative hemolysin
MRPLSPVLLSLLLVAVFAGACSAPQNTPLPAPTAAPAATSALGIANPASVNCEKLGGKTSIQTRADGAQYGICVFAGNKQCEEWALFRGECPAGGVDISAYVTPAAQFCVIAGGQYKATANTGQASERGTCTFKNGKSCDAGDYLNGKCSPNQ